MITASMASMPERVELLEIAVNSLLPQVDKLNIYLNEWDSVPDFLNRSKINAVRSQDALGDLGAKGKFYWCEEVQGIHLTVDDDIRYPADYADKMKAGIEKYPNHALAFHGARFNGSMLFHKRMTIHVNTTYTFDSNADFIGTGVAGYDTEQLKIRLDDFKSNNWADGWFAIAARNQGAKLKVLAHHREWIEMMKPPGKTIYAENKTNEMKEQIQQWLSQHWNPSIH